MTLQSKATTAMVAAAIKPRKSIKDALKFKSKEDWIKTIKSDVVEKPPVSGYGTMDTSRMLPGLGGDPEIKKSNKEEMQ